MLQWSCTVVTKVKGVAIGYFDIFWLTVSIFTVNAALRLLRSARSGDKVILHYRFYIHSMSLTLLLASNSSTIASFTFHLRSSLINTVSFCHFHLSMAKASPTENLIDAQHKLFSQCSLLINVAGKLTQSNNSSKLDTP